MVSVWPAAFHRNASSQTGAYYPPCMSTIVIETSRPNGPYQLSPALQCIK